MLDKADSIPSTARRPAACNAWSCIHVATSATSIQRLAVRLSPEPTAFDGTPPEPTATARSQHHHTVRTRALLGVGGDELGDAILVNDGALDIAQLLLGHLLELGGVRDLRREVDGKCA